MYSQTYVIKKAYMGREAKGVFCVQCGVGFSMKKQTHCSSVGRSTIHKQVAL